MNSITINNELITIEVAKKKLLGDLPNWERHIYDFLCEWWNKKDYVTLHTSGSTGAPKQIKQIKSAMEASAKMTGEYFEFENNQKVLLCLPANFIAGKMMLVRAIVWNLDVVSIEPKIDLNIPATEISFAAMTPPQVENNITNISNIKNILIGGAPIHQALEKELNFLDTNFFASYGMTETVSHVAIRNLQDSKPEIYLALNGVTFSTGLNDELIIKAPHIVKKPLITNDYVELLNQNQFIWKGRLDFVINSGGLKISPETMEQRISHLIPYPFFIHGMEDNQWGHIPVLIIQTNEIQERTILQELKGILSSKEIPKKVLKVSEFIQTGNGKLNRNKTFELAMRN